jgi:hypothetical protein
MLCILSSVYTMTNYIIIIIYMHIRKAHLVSIVKPSIVKLHEITFHLNQTQVA